MSIGQNFREAFEAAKGVNLCSIGLAAQKPALLRSYVSFCLRKYDDLMGKGLPSKSPIAALTPTDVDTLTIPLRFRVEAAPILGRF